MNDLFQFLIQYFNYIFLIVSFNLINIFFHHLNNGTLVNIFLSFIFTFFLLNNTLVAINSLFKMNKREIQRSNSGTSILKSYYLYYLSYTDENFIRIF